ncbi:hypothetical protein LCGC14_2659200, partial [marine sediment metagenome]
MGYAYAVDAGTSILRRGRANERRRLETAK